MITKKQIKKRNYDRKIQGLFYGLEDEEDHLKNVKNIIKNGNKKHKKED